MSAGDGLREAVDALAERWQRHSQLFVAPADRATREDWEFVARTLRALLAEHPAPPAEAWLCSQCGEMPSVMVKIGTPDGWCIRCLDEAATPPAEPHAEHPATPVEVERNPYLPEAPGDGRHIFPHGSYRCSRCGVYNRTDSPPFHEPCQGQWAESGKMRAAADRRWAEEKISPPAEPDAGDVALTEAPVRSVELVAAARWLLLLRDDPALSGSIYRGALGMWSEMTSAPNETTAVAWAVHVAALDTLTAHVNPF